MKKRVLCLILALACLFALAAPSMAYSGFQDFLNATGRLKGVDYTRIKQDTRQYIRVTFEIGSQSFNGMLKKGYRLEDKEADGIIIVSSFSIVSQSGSELSSTGYPLPNLCQYRLFSQLR